MVHERAGQVALPEDLVDVDAMIAAYYDLVPDPTNIETVSVMPIKGGRKMLRMRLGRHPEGVSVTAFLCAGQQEANVLRHQYGGAS